MNRLKLAAAIGLATATTLSYAARNPSDVYGSELKNVKLQYPTSSDEVCDSESQTSCLGFRQYGLWWMYDSNDNVVHAISGNDGERNELRNRKEFNAKTTSKTFSGTLQRISTSSIKHVTVLQLHRSVSGSKPAIRIQYDHNNDQYEYAVASDESASNGYCKGSFSTSGSGAKFYSISQVNVNGERMAKMTLGGETKYCSLDDWPSDTTYYYKMGTYLSDGNGSASFKFKDWDWNQ